MKVAAIILLILFLIAMLWLGADVRYDDDGLAVWVRAAFLRFQVYPIRKKKPQKPKKPSNKPKKPAEHKVKPAAKPKKEPDIWVLVGVGLRAAGRLRRKIKITLIRLRYTAGSRDPYNTAMQYGHVSAALGVLAPIIDNAFIIKSRDIDVSADFDLEKPKIRGELRLGLYLWQIIYIGCAVLIDYINMQKNS